MKTYRSLLLVAALVGSAALLSAGPTTQFPSRTPAPKSDASTVTAPASTQSAPMVAAATCAMCACCKKAS